MRTDRSIIYHIYPLGFCAVEPRNGFASEPVNLNFQNQRLAAAYSKPGLRYASAGAGLGVFRTRI